LPAAASPNRADSSGFGVYVHWPFCSSKCPYCDFNSHVRSDIDEELFVGAFVREIGHWAKVALDRRVDSIFFGGGTPSLMSAVAVDTILEAIARNWMVHTGTEITLEANPSSVEAARFRDYRSAGVNRVSLGVQSLDAHSLRTLGRLHTVDEARSAINVARSTFDRYSFDLIYARVGQTIAEWRRELSEALAIGSRHLSLYQLTIEAGTPFAELHSRGKITTPDEDAAREFFEVTAELTQRAGLPAYEISNHAAPGEESRHNLLYWRYGEYVGVGPGAHSRVVMKEARHASQNLRAPGAWAAQVERLGHGLAEDVVLTQAEEADEMLLMGLRLSEGLDLAKLASLTGYAPCDAAIKGLVALNLVVSKGSRLSALPGGRPVLNEIVRRLAGALRPVTAEN
jgi:oxygen-independent coproporphyrinogen-3 oxidase